VFAFSPNIIETRTFADRSWWPPPARAKSNRNIRISLKNILRRLETPAPIGRAKKKSFLSAPRIASGRLSERNIGGTTNPEGVRQLTDKAEARRAASAQASFPSRRAREKTVLEKENGIK
jgi:hypothetical protein